MDRRCDRCGRETPAKEQMYTLRLEMFARAEPLIITKEDLLHDHAVAMEKLVEQMESMDPAEAEDQVHESYVFDLCTKCRNLMHRQLKSRVESDE